MHPISVNIGAFEDLKVSGAVCGGLMLHFFLAQMNITYIFRLSFILVFCWFLICFNMFVVPPSGAMGPIMKLHVTKQSLFAEIKRYASNTGWIWKQTGLIRFESKKHPRYDYFNSHHYKCSFLELSRQIGHSATSAFLVTIIRVVIDYEVASQHLSPWGIS